MEPIFISGLYRSGTKLLINLINKSPDVKTTYDTIHFLRFSYKKYRPICENYKQLVSDTSKRIASRWDMSFDVKKTIECIEKHREISEAVVYDCMMRIFLNIQNNERWAEKTNVEWEGMLNFINLFPEGKAVHIYRDPRAVLASYKHMTNQPGKSYLDAVFASLAMFNFIDQEHIKRNPNIYLVKYEDLVINPKRHVNNICEFLNIEFNNEMLMPSTYTNKYGDKLDTDSSFTKQKRGIDASSLNIWKDKLSSVEIYLSEMVLKEKLKNFGYELNGIDLSKEEFVNLYDILHDEFVVKRYKYWLKRADGVQAYPNTENAYIQ